MKRNFILVTVLLLILSSMSFSHGGRTDKNGCHVEKKTGERHCH
ncbi:MAG: YHYH domain-containing protein [Sebaldella sp.]|nr:YHYH domain-containing protein [Sebaldella sp.]